MASSQVSQLRQEPVHQMSGAIFHVQVEQYEALSNRQSGLWNVPLPSMQEARASPAKETKEVMSPASTIRGNREEFLD